MGRTRQIKKKYNIPVVIFNSTISSLNNNQLKILQMVDKIYVRELYSYNYLKKNKIKYKFSLDFFICNLINTFR